MKIVKVDPKKYVLDDRVPPSEYLNIDKMVELKYTWLDKLEVTFFKLKKRFKQWLL